MNELRPIEKNNQRILTTAQIAEQYGTTEKAIKQNFSNNKGHYTEGKHYYYLTGDELKAFKNEVENFDLVGKNASSLYLWTEKGAFLHAKSLNTPEAWDAYDFLIENYFNPVKKQEIPSMSMMEMIAHIANNAVETEKRLTAIEATQAEQQKQIETVRNAFAIDRKSWRNECRSLIRKIAKASDEYVQKVWIESYTALEHRAKCDLRQRLENKKARAYEGGMQQYKINRLNPLDVIEEDERLTEIYISILREMAVKNGVKADSCALN